MTFSAAFAAIANFYTAVSAASIGVAVSNGASLTADAGAGYLLVGFGADDNPQAIESVASWRTFGRPNPPREEEFFFHNFLVCQTGDTDLAALRTTLATTADNIEAVIAADRTLAGAVRICRVGSFRTIELQAGEGAAMGLEFQLVCEQRIT